MPSTYFIVDFAYNPDSDKPLAIFELGDAFFSEYPDKKMGAQQLTPSQYLYLDINKQHKDPLFILAVSSGLRIKSLNNNMLIDTFDKEKPSFTHNEFCNSTENIKDLLLSIFSNAGKNKDGRELIFHVSNRRFYQYYDGMEQYDPQVKLLNHTSETLFQSFYNKATLTESANGSPIFPETLIIPGWNEIDESAVDRFLVEHKAEYYVIKPAVGSHAVGVHVVKASQLKKTLIDNENHDYHGFIVQVCHLSKQLEYNGEFYNAKSRAIVRADFLPNSEEPKISLVTAFWELATSPINNLLDDKNVITGMDANPEGILEISAEDLHHITHEFTLHLPVIIKKMQCHDDLTKTNKRQTEAPDKARLAKNLLSFLDVQSIVHSYQTVPFNRNLMGVKHFVIDVLGLNKEFHDWVNYSNDSIEEYVNNATAIFCGNKNQILNHISLASVFKQEAPSILMATLILTGAMLMLDDSNFWSFNLKLLAGIVSATIGNLFVNLVSHPAVVRASNSFFKPVENQIIGNLGGARPNFQLEH